MEESSAEGVWQEAHEVLGKEVEKKAGQGRTRRPRRRSTSPERAHGKRRVNISSIRAVIDPAVHGRLHSPYNLSHPLLLLHSFCTVTYVFRVMEASTKRLRLRKQRPDLVVRGLRVFWITVVLWGEIGVFYWSLSDCAWPDGSLALVRGSLDRAAVSGS
jgi:hypothetical protein